MLHIIILILKIIGFVILGVLALVILLSLILLFAPFKYNVQGEGKNHISTLKGSVRFYWLFRLFYGEVVFDNGKISFYIRAAWKKFRSGSGPHEKTEGEYKTADRSGGSRNDPVFLESKTDNLPETQLLEKKTEDIPNGTAEKSNQGSEAAGYGKKVRKTKKKSSLFNKIIKLWEKIKYTFKSICDKIKMLDKKKKRLAAFIQNDIHQKAFRHLLGTVKKVLFRLRPKKADIRIEFGCSDPAYTGYILAGISVLYPLIGEYTQIEPDFNNKKLIGSIEICGKIRLVYLAAAAFGLLLDKNVRRTVRHLRKFRL